MSIPSESHLALVILVLKWAHWPFNSRQFPRYDATKLGRFRGFRSLSMEKSPKIDPNFQRDPKIWATGWSDDPKNWYTTSSHGYLGHMGDSHQICTMSRPQRTKKLHFLFCTTVTNFDVFW